MLRTLDDKHIYTTFCEQYGVPIFAEPWYLDAVSKEGKWSAVVLLDGEQMVAALPYFHKWRYGFHYVTMPKFTKHLGILAGSQPLNRQAVRLLIGGLPRLAGFDQQFDSSANSALEFLPDRFHKIPHHKHIIRLDEQPDWRRNLNRNMRRNIKKAEGQLTLIEDVSIDTFLSIIRLSFDRQEIPPPYSDEQLRLHLMAILDKQRGRLFMARDKDGQIHSVACLIWDESRAYYHLSGDDPTLRKSGAGIWLIAQAITYTQEHLQLPIFDFEGSMIPRIAAIREQYGAVREDYFRVQRFYSPLYWLLKRLRP